MMSNKLFSPEKLRIIVVDDDPYVRDSLRCFFEDHGFVVTAVESGEAAIQAANEAVFDFAIVDIRLPKMDGTEVIVQLNKQHPHLRFLIYTGSVEYWLPAELSRLGIRQNQVYQKPISDMSLFMDAMKQIWCENN